MQVVDAQGRRLKMQETQLGGRLDIASLPAAQGRLVEQTVLALALALALVDCAALGSERAEGKTM
jgi:hypothetical protein